MKSKLFFILGIVFLLGLVSAGNYVFENTSGTELVKIWGENGNVYKFENTDNNNLSPQYGLCGNAGLPFLFNFLGGVSL
jgi:hypothetical protein